MYFTSVNEIHVRTTSIQYPNDFSRISLHGYLGSPVIQN